MKKKYTKDQDEKIIMLFKTNNDNRVITIAKKMNINYSYVNKVLDSYLSKKTKHIHKFVL